jgi:2'-5' RNA ligase
MKPEEKSGLVIPVPAAELLVRRWRESLDPGCILGVPAHITVLFPFASPKDIDEEKIATLETYFSQVVPFEFGFKELGWFDDKVVYLAPAPDDVFRGITQGLTKLYPMYLPYEGKHGESTPHLTIGDGSPLDLLQEAAMNIAPHLPLTASADRVWLMAGGTDPGSWTLRHEFSFGQHELFH